MTAPLTEVAELSERRQGTLLRTKEGDLDLGWLILMIAFLNGIVVFDLAAWGLIPGPNTEAWVWYSSLTLFAFLSGVAIARARLIVSAKIGQHDYPPRGPANPPYGE